MRRRYFHNRTEYVAFARGALVAGAVLIGMYSLVHLSTTLSGTAELVPGSVHMTFSVCCSFGYVLAVGHAAVLKGRLRRLEKKD